MSNTLLTTLKDATGNGGRKIGEINIIASQANDFNIILSPQSVVLRTEGELYFLDRNGNYYNGSKADSKVIITGANYATEFKLEGSGEIFINDSYTLTKYVMLSNTVNYTELISLRSDISDLRLAKSTVVGNISELAKLLSLTNFILNKSIKYSGKNCDIVTFKDCVNLETFRPQHSSIYGTLESLIEAQASSRTSGSTMSVFLLDSKATFNGQTPNTGIAHIVTFDGTGGASVSFNGSVVGSYDGTNWTY